MNPLSWLYGNGYGYLINILQLVCIVHCLLRRREYYWFFVIFFLPGLGALVYAFVNILPELRGVNLGAITEPLQSSDSRIRRAQAALEDTDTLQHRLTLAREFKRARRLEEAAATLAPLEDSMYRDDPLFRFEFAELQFLAGRGEAAMTQLDRLLENAPLELRGPAWLLKARLSEAQNDPEGAERAYQKALPNISDEEARARYASFLVAQGRVEEATPILERVQKTLRRASGQYRAENREWETLVDGLLKQVKPGA